MSSAASFKNILQQTHAHSYMYIGSYNCVVGWLGFECEAHHTRLFGVNCVAVIANNRRAPGTHSYTVYSIGVCICCMLLHHVYHRLIIIKQPQHAVVCRHFGSRTLVVLGSKMCSISSRKCPASLCWRVGCTSFNVMTTWIGPRMSMNCGPIWTSIAFCGVISQLHDACTTAGGAP